MQLLSSSVIPTGLTSIHAFIVATKDRIVQTVANADTAVDPHRVITHVFIALHIVVAASQTFVASARPFQCVSSA